MDEKLIRSIGTKKPCREKCTPPDKRPKLNENQQIVLEWWVKKLNEEGEDADPLGVICAMQSYGLREEKIYDAAVNLTPAQQFQVLAAFAEWGMKEVAE